MELGPKLASFPSETNAPNRVSLASTPESPTFSTGSAPMPFNISLSLSLSLSRFYLNLFAFIILFFVFISRIIIIFFKKKSNIIYRATDVTDEKSNVIFVLMGSCCADLSSISLRCINHSSDLMLVCL